MAGMYDMCIKNPSTFSLTLFVLPRVSTARIPTQLSEDSSLLLDAVRDSPIFQLDPFSFSFNYYNL